MDEEKVTLWKQRMTSFQSSGLSIKKWCRENHIAPPTFYYWRSRLENEIVSNQHFEKAAIPTNVLPHSIATPSLVAHALAIPTTNEKLTKALKYATKHKAS